MSRSDPVNHPADAERRPRLRIARIAWERVQLVLHVDDTAVDVDLADLVLRPRFTDAAEPMPPTRASAAPGSGLLRFNVILGPGQLPLAPGSWVLADRAAPDRRLRCAGDPVAIGLAERTFRYRGGRYRVEPRLDPDTGELELRIANPRSPARTGWPRRLWRRAAKLLRPRQRTFDALYAYHRARRDRRRRRIVFTSDSRTELSGNLAVVHDRMVERGLDRTWEIDMIFKPSVADHRSWRDRWRLPRLLGRADVILLDDFQPIIYRLPDGGDPRIIQLWHASGAFKTVGYSRVGKPGGPSPYWRRHKNYTYAIVSGHHDVPFYAEAFGLPEERVAPTGIPRMDRFFDPVHREASIAGARRSFPEIAGRFVILFAPTFRGHGPRDARYDHDRVDWHGLHAVCVERDAIVIVKMHPFVRVPPPIPEPLRDRIIDASATPLDVNDLLFAVDLLITDYSSIVFEFSTQLKPMLFFAYDLEEYVAQRDFYVPFEEFVPGRIARTFDEVLDAIRSDAYEAEKVPIFRSRHFDHLDGGATDRVIDELILPA